MARRRPELIVGPAWIVWGLANGLPITFGRPFVLSVFSTATFRGSGENVFPITYGCAIFLFWFSMVLLTELSWARRLLVASAVPFAFTHLYEVPYDLIGYYYWPGDYAWAVWPIVLLLNATWLTLGASTFPFWRLTRAGTLVLAAFLGCFAIWWIWSVPWVPPVLLPQNPEGGGYILSKAILAVFVALLLWGYARAPRVVYGPDRDPLAATRNGCGEDDATDRARPTVWNAAD